MPYNGSGTFVRLSSWVVDAANGIDILSTKMDAEDNGFAAGLTNCITRDGQSPPSADIPWGGKRLMNLGAATAGTDALNRDTADARYALTGGALSCTTLAASGNATVGGTLVVTGSISTNAGVFNATDGTAPGLNLIKTGTGAGTAQIINTGALQMIAGAAGQSGIVRADTIVLENQNASVTFATVTSSSFASAVPITCPTPTAGDNSTKAATTAYVVAALASYATLASPALTGTPTAPTAAVNTNTTQIASTAYVMAAKAPTGQNIASAVTVTPNATDDLVAVTALAANVTLANPAAAPADGWGIVIRLKDNGTPRTIAYGTQYRAVGTALPTTTVASKNLYLGCIWNNADSKLDVVSVAQE